MTKTTTLTPEQIPAALMTAIREAGLRDGEYTVEATPEKTYGRPQLRPMRYDVRVSTVSYRYQTTTRWSEHIDFGLQDSKGRAVGVWAYLSVEECSGEERSSLVVCWYAGDEAPRSFLTVERDANDRPTIGDAWKQDGAARIAVQTHATRDQTKFGTWTAAVRCGAANDTKAIKKARKTLVKKVEGARKRYTKQFAKAA